MSRTQMKMTWMILTVGDCILNLDVHAVAQTVYMIDLLDEFSAVNPDSEKSEGGPRELQGRSASAATGTAEAKCEEGSTQHVLSDNEFAKQLQAGMADLLGDIETTVSQGRRGSDFYVRTCTKTTLCLRCRQPEMQAQWESMFKELGAAAASSQAGPSEAPGGGPAAKTDASFQETIRKTMERMQASGDQATAAASAEGSDDFLAELLKQMQAGGLEGEGDEEDLSKMLMGMMDQLTHKEILYEPMKELNDKFPEWLQKNKDKTSKEDLRRYEEQLLHVKEIVARFEQTGYADSNAADREYIIDRMQKVSPLLCPVQRT